MTGRNHAIVYGGSGVVGWELVNQVLNSYPLSGSFSKVTAITNRPLDLSNSLWPSPGPDTPELQLVSGIDLRQGDGQALAQSLKHAVADFQNVTHVYYSVFTAVDDDIEEVAVNRQMFQNVVDAHNRNCPDLKFVAFPGGTWGYGIYVPGGTFTPPLREEMVNSLPPDYEKTVVYPVYREILRKASSAKSWTWCEVCPDAIIGFTPNGSQFSLALHWAQYLSLYAYNHGIGPQTAGNSAPVKVLFPGNEAGATSLFTPVSSKTLAQFMIYASLNPETCGDGRLFNVADSASPCTYGDLWPELARWFGLEGVSPTKDQGTRNELKTGELPDSTPEMPPGEYITDFCEVFKQHGYENALRAGVSRGKRQLDSVGYWLTFDRQLDLNKLIDTGFQLDGNHVDGWLEAFEMFRKAKLIL